MIHQFGTFSITDGGTSTTGTSSGTAGAEDLTGMTNGKDLGAN